MVMTQAMRGTKKLKALQKHRRTGTTFFKGSKVFQSWSTIRAQLGTFGLRVAKYSGFQNFEFLRLH